MFRQISAALTVLLAFTGAAFAANPKVPHTNVSQFPRYVSMLPAIFRGNWDEIITDGCEARETRYSFDATTAANFEVVWNVTRIKLLSATAADLDLSMYDENKNQVNQTWKIEVVDSGQTLRFRNADSYLYRKCPKH